MAIIDKFSVDNVVYDIRDSAAGLYTAPAYSNLATYSAGEYVTKDGKTYICLEDITTAESWTPAHWQEEPVGTKISELQTAFDSVTEKSKNLLPADSKTATVNNVGATYSKGVLALSGTGNASGGRLNAVSPLFSLNAGTYTLSRDNTTAQMFLEQGSSIIAQLNEGTSSTTFTLNANTSNLYLAFNTVSGTSYSQTINLQIESGSTATDILPVGFLSADDSIARTKMANDKTELQAAIAKAVQPYTSIGGITDCNSADVNRIYMITNTSGISNLPINQQGILISFSLHSDGILQLYAEASNARNIYRRIKWASWGNWDVLQTREQLPVNVLTVFDNITCCGDSLTYSQVYTSASTSRQAYITYPEALEKQTGTSTTALATAGYSASDWWENYETDIVQKTNQLAIVYLGNNGGFTDTLATDAPENTDPSTWADTNTGCLAKIVQKFKSLDAKVCLVKCYATSGTGTSDLTTTNSVITQVAERFGCGLVESTYLSAAAYHYYPDLSGRNDTHYNDLGYSGFASKLIDNISFMSGDYLKYLIPS